MFCDPFYCCRDLKSLPCLERMPFGQKGILVLRLKWPYLTLAFELITHIFVISRYCQLDECVGSILVFLHFHI